MSIDKPLINSSESFDHDKEKKRRMEIRGLLEKTINEQLKEVGFKRQGKSMWVRHIYGSYHILYLQRSVHSHQYFLEVGICEEADIPEGEKPDVVFCKSGNRKRIDTGESLKFEIPDGRERYPNEQYFFPSVSSAEVEDKLASVNEITEAQVLAWFEEHNGQGV